MNFKIIFKRRLSELIKIIQKILINAFLILIYFFGLGVTLVFVFLFSRKLIYSDVKKKSSTWLETEGYSPDLGESFRQS